MTELENATVTEQAVVTAPNQDAGLWLI